MRLGRTLLIAAATIWVAGVSRGAAAPPAAAEPHSASIQTVAAAIDRLLEERLAQAGIPASPPADDAEFLRRATLDLIGRIPTYDEAVAFLASDDPQKRRNLIDRLLGDPAYGEHFAAIWNELIVPRDAGSTKAVRDPFTPWLAEQFNRVRGWDAIVADLVTVEGKIRERPQAGFILANSENFEPQPNLLADATARLFLGVQLRCAECHDHPFAPWKQTDFWGMAAFFSRLRKGYSDGKNPTGWTLTESPPEDEVNQKFAVLKAAPNIAGAAILVPETGGKLAKEVVRAKFLGGSEIEWADNGPFRSRFAAWTTSSDNPWFAANAVNRLWHHCFGRGLVHPLGGFRADNPPSHPEVLDLLTKELTDSGFDLKHVLRIICSTRAYQRTSRPLPGNAAEDQLFSRMAVKPLRPEMLYDSLGVLLFPPRPKAGGKPQGKMGVQPLPDISRGEFVRLFGTRPDENEGSIVNSGVPQFLRLLNGKLLNEETPGLSRLLKGNPAPADAIDALYLAALARRPTTEERQWTTGFVAEHDDQQQAYTGVLWTLVNNAEFVLNH